MYAVTYAHLFLYIRTFMYKYIRGLNKPLELTSTNENKRTKNNTK